MSRRASAIVPPLIYASTLVGQPARDGLAALAPPLAPVAEPRFESEQAVRDHVRARLSRDRVEAVSVDAVELFPEGVGAVRGTLRFRGGDAESRVLSFDLMVGHAVEADPHGYGEGDNVDSPLNHHPKILTRVEPIYPEAAREQRVTGAVRLFTLVGRDGSTVVIGVMTPLGHGCTEAAIAAVEKWTWRPRVFFGREVDALGLATVPFPPRAR